MATAVVTPKYSDLPPGAQIVHDPSQAAPAYSDLPPGATIVHDPSQQSAATAATANAGAQASGAGEQPSVLARTINAASDWLLGTHDPSDLINGPKLALEHPSLEGQAVAAMGKNIYRGMSDTWNRAKQEWNSPGVMNKVNAGIHAVESGVPVLGPAVAQIDQEAGQGNYPEALGHALAVAGPLVAGSPEARANLGDVASSMGDAASAAADKVNPRGYFAQKMNTVSPTERFTPQERYEAAKAHGINMDLADATDAAIPRGVKKVTQLSSAGESRYARTQEANLGALQDWSTQYANELSPNSGEAAGAAVQQGINSVLEREKQTATQNFATVDDLAQGVGVDMKPVKAGAQAILDDTSFVRQNAPSLDFKRLTGILKNIANLPDEAQFSDAQALRSRLLDESRTPDLAISDQAQGAIKKLTGLTDSQMIAASKYTPDLENGFRDANAHWQQFEQDFNSPRSPLYQALKEPAAEKVPGKFLATGTTGGSTTWLGKLRQYGIDTSPLQRAAVEKILGRDATGGGYDYRGMPGRLKQYDPDYLNALLGPEKATELYKMARVGKTVTDNPNPSGTTRIGQPVLEAMGVGSALARGNPLALAYPAAQHVISRLMNSPGAIDYLTQPKKLGAGAIAASFRRPVPLIRPTLPPLGQGRNER